MVSSLDVLLVLLLITLNNWTLNVDNGMKVDVVYTDIAKAFDTVSHSKLLLKVEAYGFKSNLLQWIRAFLNDRTQCVYVGLDVSSPKSITSGTSGFCPWPSLVSDICQ